MAVVLVICTFVIISVHRICNMRKLHKQTPANSMSNNAIMSARSSFHQHRTSARPSFDRSRPASIYQRGGSVRPSLDQAGALLPVDQHLESTRPSIDGSRPHSRMDQHRASLDHHPFHLASALSMIFSPGPMIPQDELEMVDLEAGIEHGTNEKDGDLEIEENTGVLENGEQDEAKMAAEKKEDVDKN
ncbi:hypothetical protein FKW77_009878 [Venturia effusa]|uniref:Uncharacterized protein n=1 Tax=Venturia effusa TaxID=50376 RepID=A0A517LEQ8_9PEZI|nr:hypothetical protein FKW77_009878 [Venturia effusa]